jgi:hypothetical protein
LVPVLLCSAYVTAFVRGLVMVTVRVVPLVVPTGVEGNAAGAGAVGLAKPWLVPLKATVGLALLALLLLTVKVADRALVAAGARTGDVAGVNW